MLWVSLASSKTNNVAAQIDSHSETHRGEAHVFPMQFRCSCHACEVMYQVNTIWMTNKPQTHTTLAGRMPSNWSEINLIIQTKYVKVPCTTIFKFENTSQPHSILHLPYLTYDLYSFKPSQAPKHTACHLEQCSRRIGSALLQLVQPSQPTNHKRMIKG